MIGGWFGGDLEMVWDGVGMVWGCCGAGLGMVLGCSGDGLGMVWGWFGGWWMVLRQYRDGIERR